MKLLACFCLVVAFIGAVTVAPFAFASNLTQSGAHINVHKVWSVNGMDQPESVLAAPDHSVLYVSNMNGSPVEDNGEGYISVLSSEGEIIQKHWVTGLGAPKGMTIYGDYLYVADLQALHVINRQTGQVERSAIYVNAGMLNDVVSDNDGYIYVTDLLGGGVYRYNSNHGSNYRLERWLSSEQLPHPNGIAFDQAELQVATWGEGLRDDFTTEVAGSVYRVNIGTRQLTPYEGASELGNLDGLSMVGDNSFWVNDWMTGEVFYHQHGETYSVFNAGRHAADISVSDDYLYVPMMFDERIDAYFIDD